MKLIVLEMIMAEQPVNLSTVLYLVVFSRGEPSHLQGDCGRLRQMSRHPRPRHTSKSTTHNVIARALAIGLLEKTERRSYCAVSLPNNLTYGEAMMVPYPKATHDLRSFEVVQLSR